MYKYLLLLVLCGLLLPVWGAETPEATVKRVKQLESARLVLQADLATTQQVLDSTRAGLKIAQKHLSDEEAKSQQLTDALAKETTERKALQDKLEALQKQLTDLISANAQKNAADTTAMDGRVTRLERAQSDLAGKEAADNALQAKNLSALRDELVGKMNAMNADFAKQFAALRGDLDKEKQERIVADTDALTARKKMLGQADTDRRNTYIMGGLLGILSLVHK